MICEGSRVAYVGDGGGGVAVGDAGRVVSVSGSASHVRWLTGAQTGAVMLVQDLDLVVGGKDAPSTYDGLDSGSLVSVAVRDTYDSTGPVGLLNALNEEGHLATFASYAEGALEAVAAQITHDPSMREVLGHLESDEQACLVTLAASVLLRDAFGGTE